MCPLQNSYVELLAPTVMALGGEAFASLLGPESRALIDEISAHIKEDPVSFLVFFCHVREDTARTQSP